METRRVCQGQIKNMSFLYRGELDQLSLIDKF